MNLIRGPEGERRVPPVESGHRARVKPGLRRDRPQDWLEEERGEEDGFAEELARQEQEEDGRERLPRREEPPASDEAAPRGDRVEIAGLAGQPPETEQPASARTPRLDVRA